MEQLVQTIITQLPNLGVAVWMLWQQQQTIKSLLDNQAKLIDRLLSYADNDRATAARIIATSASESRPSERTPNGTKP